MTFAYRSALHTSKMIMLHLLESEREMCLGHSAIQIHACFVFFITKDHSSSNFRTLASAPILRRDMPDSIKFTLQTMLTKETFSGRMFTSSSYRNVQRVARA